MTLPAFVSGQSVANDVKALPNNLDVEQALLGCLLFDNAAYEYIPDSFKAEHFYEPFHVRLYAYMVSLIAKGQLAEPILLMERFKADPAFIQFKGLGYLADLVDRAPPAIYAPDYAVQLYDLAIRRELIRIGGDVSAQADEDHTITAREIASIAEERIYSAVEAGSGPEGSITFATALTGALRMTAEAFERDGSIPGVATGLIDLDRKLGGLHPSDLLILAGRPSMGKTALATNIAFNVAKAYQFEPQPDGTHKTIKGGVVQFFSLEMSAEQLALRILAEASGVSSDRLRKGEIDASEYGRVRDAALEIQESPLYIDATGGLSIGKLAARARRQKRRTGLDLIVVDYLQLCTAPNRRGEGRVNEVTEITQALKALAKELNCPVLALSQLSREVEKRDDKRPMLSDLRESGSIEQDADVVAFVYRAAYYKSREEPKENTPEHLTWQDEMAEIAHQAEVIIGKQRHGPIGTVNLSFNEELTKFGSLGNVERYPSRHPYRDN